MAAQNPTELLTAFDLSETEAQLYVHLLNNPPQTFLELSRSLGIPRTSIYDNSQKLIEKGLLERVVAYKSQKLQAAPLDSLQNKIDKEREKVSILEQTLEDIKKSIRQNNNNSNPTEVRYYKGTEGLQQMLWNSLKAQGEIVGYASRNLFDFIDEKFQARYEKEFLRLTLPCRYIIYSNIPFQNEAIRVKSIDPHNLYLAGNTLIYNDTYASIYCSDNEISGMEIENPDFTKTQKSIFELLWGIAEPIKK